MQVSVQIIAAPMNIGESHRQVEEPFGAALAALAQTEAPFERMGGLCIMLSLLWPTPPSRPSGSYHAPDATFYCRSAIDYAGWVRGDWAGRVAVLADAVQAAVKAIHKTRLSVAERERLQHLVEETRAGLTTRPPASLLPVGPVWLIWSEGSESPGISYGPPTGFEASLDGRIQQMSAVEALDAVKPPAPEPSMMFKLYRRRDEAMEYFEAWPVDGLVIEHRGVCGTTGEKISHPARDDAAQKRILMTLAQAARRDGFRAIPASRLATLIVSRAVRGQGSVADLDERHALEKFLDGRTGWLGLGHCDGGSIGGGSMESFCFVVDYEIARAALAPELKANGFEGFEITKGADGCTVRVGGRLSRRNSS